MSENENVGQDPSKEAMRACMHLLIGRAAIERCIRASGAEPPADRMERTRAHLEAHGATVSDQGGIVWPVPQSPSLSYLVGGHRRARAERASAIVDRQEARARGVTRG